MENAEKMQWVLDGTSSWKIVVGEKASLTEKYAGEELQHFIKEISGAAIPIVKDTGKVQDNEIIIGTNGHLLQLGLQPDLCNLGEEGFIIRTLNRCMVIAGKKPRGTLYGVYAFLEEHLGCRWFSSSVSVIPKRNSIEIEPVHTVQVPVLEYREPFYTDAFDGDWSARNRMNGKSSRLEEKHGGKITYGDYFVHTFYKLLPPAEYFHQHPEYYSEVNGVRIADFGKEVTDKTGQLCMTHPGVLDIVTEKVKRYLREHPDVSILSISQNDTYPDQNNYCQCEKCAEIDRREGSPSGSLLYFVNRVAERIEQEFPHVAIDTLAYRYSRKPPKTIKPRQNVIVRLCSIECCFSHPIESCDGHHNLDREVDTSFKSDLEGWSKICNRLYIWDYVTNFAHYLMPFPNMGVLQPNIRYFIQNNVKGIFEEGNYSSGGHGEFAELRAYLLAKVLWNPDCDVNQAMDDFLTGYYGEAAGCIKEYLDLLQKKVDSENIHVSIYDEPDSAYLSEDLLSEAEGLFDRAVTLATDVDCLKRVKTAQLTIKYVRLCRYPKDAADFGDRVDAFFDEVKACGITDIREGRSLEESRRCLKEA